MRDLSKYILYFVAISILSSCASALMLLRLEDRTLLISPIGPALVYPYYKTVCKYPNRHIFKQCEQVHTMLQYDLNDEGTRKMLIDKGFSCSTKRKYVY